MDPDSKPNGQRTQKGWEPGGGAVQVGKCRRQWDACGKTQALLFDEVGDFDEERRSGGWNLLARDKMKRTRLQHGAGEVAHQGTGLEMEVAQHDIGAPAANQLNDTCVDAATQ